MWDGIEQWSLSNAVHIIDIGSKFETKSDNVNPVPLGSGPGTAGLVQNRNLDRIFIYPSPNKKHIFLERVTSLFVNFLSKWYLASLSLPRSDAIDFRSCNSMAAWTGNLFDSMYWGCRPLILSVTSHSLSGHHMYVSQGCLRSGLWKLCSDSSCCRRLSRCWIIRKESLCRLTWPDILLASVPGVLVRHY